jgi:ABC-type sugar transport system permease subunit
MLTVPVVVAYTAEMKLYQSGPINAIISKIIGVDFKPAWLTNPDIALATVALLEIWNWTPFSFIILLAGLSAIPKEPIEAAEILGASKWHIFWEVQLPPGVEELVLRPAGAPRGDGGLPRAGRCFRAAPVRPQRHCRSTSS